MKRKIALLLITGICLANTVPCFASPSMKVSVSSSEENQYSTLPDGDTLQKDVGFRPKAPASLAGGYLFGSGNITESFDLDSNGAPVNKQKGISFKYIKKDNNTSKSVSLSAEPASGQSLSSNASVIKYRETDLYYSTAVANSLAWIDGDVRYILMDINKIVTRDELVAMAEDMIDLGKDLH